MPLGSDHWYLANEHLRLVERRVSGLFEFSAAATEALFFSCISGTSGATGPQIACGKGTFTSSTAEEPKHDNETK